MPQLIESFQHIPHQLMTKGARSDLLVQQLPEHGLNVELLVAPKDGLIDVEAAVQRCI